MEQLFYNQPIYRLRRLENQRTKTTAVDGNLLANLQRIPFAIKTIKIVLINITNGTTAVVASGFQCPLFSFHANSSESRLLNSIALASQQTILRKSRFQVSKQNSQGLGVLLV